jgi:tricorn protease
MIKHIVSTSVILLGFVFSVFSQSPSWLRYPSISPDGTTIAFTYRGDLYKVATQGGTAVQLTQHEAHDFMPVWSHDSKTIAFASDRYGNFDVFTIPASGGEAKRITFHSAHEYPYRFSRQDHKVYFGSNRLDAVSNRQFPTAALPELYAVSVNGGRVEQVLTTPAEDAKMSKTETL